MCDGINITIFDLELMYDSFSTAQDMRDEEINRIINSAGAGACWIKVSTQEPEYKNYVCLYVVVLSEQKEQNKKAMQANKVQVYAC